MHLHSYRLWNFRRLRDVRVDLASDISIFVGANNSGKTSATHAIELFASGSKDRFSLFDFSSHAWNEFKCLGDADPLGDTTAQLPSMHLDLWFKVQEEDLYLVLPLLPSSDWQNSLVGLRVELGTRDGPETLRRYRHAKAEAAAQASSLEGGPGSYVPWPKSLTSFLERELQAEYHLSYYVLDPAGFDGALAQLAGYRLELLAGDIAGKAVLDSLVRVDFLDAQRHLADRATNAPGAGGRAEHLSRRLSRFYKRNLAQREEDHTALRALSDSEAGMNLHLRQVFQETLGSLSELGYPGVGNPKLEIQSALNPASVMNQDARVNYVLGEGDEAVRLPDSYSGLGFKNLIYMVVEILDVHQRWRDEEEGRAPLHLIFVEEPETHLHAQLQQVFIRKVLGLVGGRDGPFASQMVVTTHSPHIVYERGFGPIRYFRRHVSDGAQETQVVNLSAFQPGDAPKDRHFLQRYLKLTHCDLFFADAAILVEGNVERLLMPLMIEKTAPRLRSAALCILEVGGAFGYRFKELVEMLGIDTLVVTDIDSVTAMVAPATGDVEAEEIEAEIPHADEAAGPVPRYGKMCLPGTDGAVTSNRTLVSWLPRLRTVAELLAAPEHLKVSDIRGAPPAKVRVAYQTSCHVAWAGSTLPLCGRTLEEAFGLENPEWCQDAAQQAVGLKLRARPADPAALAQGLHTRVTGRGFDKTNFALQVLSCDKDSWEVPSYIADGLLWLAEQVALEAREEAEAVAGAAAVAG